MTDPKMLKPIMTIAAGALVGLLMHLAAKKAGVLG